MMTKTIPAFLLLVFSSLASPIGPLLTVPVADVQGSAGTDTGWGFNLTPDSAVWLSAVTSSLIGETNPSVGWYTDLIGPQGGPSNAVLRPNSGAWAQSFDDVLGLGLGVFTVDAHAPVGAVDSGVLDVLFEEFSADPNVCPSCVTGFTDLTLPISVTVVAPAPSVPEPATTLLVAGGLLLLIGLCPVTPRFRRR